MADYTLSPNMNLPIPTVGVDPGPDWALNLNIALNTLDSHTHAPGSGVAITPDAININADLAFNGYNLTLARTLRFDPQVAAPALVTDLGCLYEVGVDLYFTDGDGNNVRITQGGGVAGSPGSIANLTSPASASYVAADGTFVWQSDTDTAANMDAGSLILRDNTASSFGVTIAPPAALAADYTLTLPATLPASTSFLTISSGGAIAARSLTSPTVQKFTSGSGTYTKPAGVLYIKVQMVGGGGAGYGSGLSNENGGNTTFGTALLVANGGSKGSDSGAAGGLGGTASLGAASGLAISGGQGCAAAGTFGGSGGASAFGGAGQGAKTGAYTQAGAGATNSGAGGGAKVGNCGGGAGGYVYALITSPSSTYAYAVGAAGIGNSLSGSGGSGVIIVEEFYQ